MSHPSSSTTPAPSINSGTSSLPAKNPTESALKKQRWDVLHWARVSYRYHKKRQWFFHVCDIATQFVCTLAGVSIFAAFFSQSKIAGGIVAALSLLALLVRYSDSKQCHIELGRRCQDLIAEIESIPSSKTTQKLLEGWITTRSKISGDEPTTLRFLAAQCEWEQCGEDGHPTHCKRPSIWHRLHMHFF